MSKRQGRCADTFDMEQTRTDDATNRVSPVTGEWSKNGATSNRPNKLSDTQIRVSSIPLDCSQCRFAILGVGSLICLSDTAVQRVPYRGVSAHMKALDTLIAVPPAPVRLTSIELYLNMVLAKFESASHLCWGAKGVGSLWRVWCVSQ